MKIKFSSAQYRLFSRYAEDVSKGVLLYSVVGYFLPSVLPSAVRPSLLEFVMGVLASLTGLIGASILVEKGELK